MPSLAKKRTRLAAPLLLRALVENWWMFLVRGIAAIVFGILAFLWPAMTLFTLVLFYGAFMLVDGVVAIVAAIRGRNLNARWWLLAAGISGVVAGILTFLWPGVSALVLLVIIACASIVGGFFQIAGAIALRKEIEGEWLLILSGIVSILFGAVLLAQPGTGALALVWLIALYAVTVGIVFVALALRLRNHKLPKR